MVNPPPQLQEDGLDPLEVIIDRYIENYEFNDGESFHRPNETERFVMKDAFIGLLADEAWDAEWGAHIRGLAATRTAAAPDLTRWPAPLHHIDDAETPEQAWEFWKPLVTNEDGSLNEQAVRDELSDFSMLLRYYSTILCEVTGNRISKETTHPSAVIGVFNDYLQERVDEAVKEELDAGQVVSASTAAPVAPTFDLQAIADAPSLFDCALCAGRGFHGIPGAPCSFCRGTGKVRGPSPTPVHPAAPQTSVPTAVPLQSPCALDRSELPARLSDEQLAELATECGAAEIKARGWVMTYEFDVGDLRRFADALATQQAGDKP